jgi:tripartite-type tricarboxylate transporter receptor subunit TctC
MAGQLLAQGAEPIGSSPQELQKFVAAEISRWTKVIEQANIRIE